MLVGTADPQTLAEGAATLPSFETQPVRLEGVETLQVLYEMESAGSASLLPPGLHPTLPPVVTWLVQRVAESPWGAFCLAQCRVECRSGLRPRGFLRQGFVDAPRAGAALAERWGFRLRPGRISLERGYDRVCASVELDEQRVLALQSTDPQPLRPADAYIVANVHLAHTPHGLRLVQIDPDWEVARAERGRPSVDCFEPEAWSSPGLRPSHPVAGLFTLSCMTLPTLRYVSRPDSLAFQGTERVDT